MPRTKCPFCHSELSVRDEYIGRTLKCPGCGGAFIMRGEHAPEEGASLLPEGALLLACLFAGHFVALMLLAIWSPTFAASLITLVVLGELAFWKRRELGRWLSEAQARRAEREEVQRTAPVKRSSFTTSSGAETGEPIIDAQVVADPANELVEIQAATFSPKRPVEIVVAPRGEKRRSMWSHLGGQKLNAKVPNDKVYFYGLGTQLDLGRGLLQSPLVYATGRSLGGTFDASLIDTTLLVAASGTPVEQKLPYWPSYYDCSPAQRSRYLDWHFGGRSDPTIELGYVFIFFYGLERRVIVDQTDELTAAHEIARLLPIYGASNSFRNYGSHLLWLSLYLASTKGDIPQTLLKTAISATQRWDEDKLGYLLAIHAARETPISAEIAFLVAKHDSRTPSSAVVRRHEDEFSKLFRAKYESRFGPGMNVKASKRDRRISYHAASATLLHDSTWESALPGLRDVRGLSSQFRPLVEIWDECISDLKDYHRVRRRVGEEATADAYEALPVELREDDHPEYDKWLRLWEQNADEEGWPLVPVGEIAKIKEFPQRDRLTKAQSRQILTTADVLGIGVEPDARLTGKSYRWDEKVSFFFLEATTEQEDTAAYNAAAVLLRLGVSIAEADGSVDVDELSHITQHLEGQFELSDNQSKRLEQLQYLLLNCPEAESKIGSFLSKRLPHDKRLLVGEFLVGIAAADEAITQAEIRALKKAYRALDLQVEELEKLLELHAPQDVAGETLAPAGTVAASEFHLDMRAISEIMTETRAVAAILHDVMAVEEEGMDEDVPPENVKPASLSAEEPEAHTEDKLAPSKPGSDATPTGLRSLTDTLSKRFQPFLRSVLTKEHWEHSELRLLATEHRVMLSGAIEAINEWSHEELGDWLIEEGEVYTIRFDLLQEIE